MSNAPPARDPKYRPFRIVAWTGYLIVAVGFSVLVTGSVMRSVWAMSSRPLAPGVELTAELCTEGARTLALELEQRRVSMGQSPTPSRVEVDWVPFRNEWMARFRQLEGQCAAATKDHPELGTLFSRLDTAAEDFTVLATQFAQQVGPDLERLRASLDGGAGP